MDIKIKGINEQILRTALAQAREGRLEILGKMLAVLPKANEKLSINSAFFVNFDYFNQNLVIDINNIGNFFNSVF